MQPAHFTKHIPLLRLPFLSTQFDVTQRDNGQSNGTAIWLSGQALALSLPSLLPSKIKGKHDRRMRAIELGSGTGFTALALCSLGWDVIATDTRTVISLVLQNNIDANRANLPDGSGCIQIRELDWTVEPEKWTWTDSSRIASHSFQESSGMETLSPPFDLVLTADTVYIPELLTPLFRTLRALSQDGHPHVFLALERRDSQLIDEALAQAQRVWFFSPQRIPNKKISKALIKAGCQWDKSEWEGVEIWKLVVNSALQETPSIGS